MTKNQGLTTAIHPRRSRGDFALKRVPGALELAAHLADAPRREPELTSHVPRCIPNGQDLGDLPAARGHPAQPFGKIDPRDGQVRRGCRPVIGQERLPLRPNSSGDIAEAFDAEAVLPGCQPG